MAIPISDQQSSQSFSFTELANAGLPPEVPAEYFVSSDDIRLAFYHFQTHKEPIAKIVFIHGGGAHSKLGYTYLAQTLKDKYAIDTYLLDLRGHGLSAGKRGDAPTPEMVFQDIKLLIQKIKAAGSQPIYLAGHSSGAGTVLNYSSWRKREPVAGYFFISPELGAKSNTSKLERTPFADVKKGKFFLNGLSGGRLYKNDYAVFFNYPASVLELQPLIVTAITVNMALALTPENPSRQFTQLTEPFGLYIGENDELFDASKVLAFGKLPSSANSNTIIKMIKNASHLSIIVNIGNEIGEAIEQWQFKII